MLAAYAVSYGTTYKGSGYSGRLYTTSSVRATSAGSGGVVASAPMAAMGSTSAYGSKTTLMQATKAASVGGVITRPTPIVLSVIPEGNPPGCDCNWVDNGVDGYYCPDCGAYLSYDDYYNGILPHGGNVCPCPIGEGWQVWLFMAAMAFVYAAIKKRHSHQTETVPSRPGC